MGSSEINDSGRFSGQRSNFSQTCSLLSQYLKEKGSFGDLTLGLTQNFELKGAPAATETMNFFPVMEKSETPTHEKLNTPIIPQMKTELSSGTKSEPETAQMTIFYGGQVIVFDDFPAEKAKEIMLLAGKSSSQNQSSAAALAPPSMVQSPAESATNIPVPVASPVSKAVPTLVNNPPQPSLASDLPIARKNSLARFLEKRKDRISSKAPYQSMAPPKPIKTEEWLGLAPQYPTSN